VFRRRSAGAPDGTAQDSPGAQSPDSPAEDRARPAAEAAKGRPTPKRSEAERGRYQPISGSRPRSAGPRTPADKATARSDRARKYEAMKRGEQWALNARDLGPAKQLARDYVDSKRRVSEYYMYILVLLVAALFVRLNGLLGPVVVALIAVMAVDGYFIRRGLRRLVAERLPGESARGLTLYAVMRAIQIRRFRMPQPRVNPGEKF
jgi:hypothetical protein